MVLPMRVSPSGKAVASQATIRGFESRHPLQCFTDPFDGVFFCGPDKSTQTCPARLVYLLRDIDATSIAIPTLTNANEGTEASPVFGVATPPDALFALAPVPPVVPADDF